MSTPNPVTPIQKLADLEAGLKADFVKDFGPDVSNLLIALQNPGTMTPIQLEVFDAGQFVAFGGKLASDLLKLAPDAQTTLVQFLQSQLSRITSAQASVKA